MAADTQSDLGDRPRRSWRQMSPSIKLYAAGGALLAVGVLCTFAVPKTSFGSWIFTFAVLLLSLGIFRECYDMVVGKKDRPIAKLGIAILTIMSAALTTGSASAIIATATGQDPSTFKTAITFMSPLAFIPFFALIAFALSLLGVPLVLILGLREKTNISAPLLLGRMVGLIGIMAFSQTALKPDGAFSMFLKNAGAYSAYMLDMHEDLACSDIKGDRITRINDDLVVIGRITESDPQFVRKACSLTLDPKTLAPPRK